MLGGGTDVTRQLQGGQIGANITLRDTTLPTDQGELDELSQNMATRVQRAMGLTLFTDPTGTVPAGGGTAGAERLCGFRQQHPGQPGGAGDSIAGARRRRADRCRTQAGYTAIINARAEQHVGRRSRRSPPMSSGLGRGWHI